MSSALAIAGVTAVLKDLIDNALIDQMIPVLGAQFKTTALPPDTITIGPDQSPQLNLFMWQVTPNAAWRNMSYPARDSAGRRIDNPPLALDLHYLLTAYGSSDLQAEILLGYAMQLLHENPVLVRAAIRKALNPPGTPVDAALLPPIYQALRASDLADQYEQIKLVQSPMNTEDVWKLWTALQAHYRPTASYTATVVLIESRAATYSALPVLTRGGVEPGTHHDHGVFVQSNMTPPVATLDSVELPPGHDSAWLGDAITLHGHDLDGTSPTLRLVNARLGIDHAITTASNAGSQAITFTLPNDAVNYPAGPYQMTLQLTKGTRTVVSNALALALAPQITALPASVALDVDGNATVTLTCTPQVRATQDVQLILGDLATLAVPFTGQIDNPTFVAIGITPHSYAVRLRVDGVDSQLIDYSQAPPVYLAAAQITVTP
jgi:hypothetical protein